MALPIFPTLKGIVFPVKRAPMFRTLHQESASGQDNPVELWTYPRWAYEVAYSFLRSDSVNLEWQTLAAFFLSQRGSSRVFQFTDPDDGTVTAQPFGTGDGTTVAFPLVRTLTGLGGITFAEPVFAPTAQTIYDNLISGTQITQAQLDSLQASIDAAAVEIQTPLPADDGTTTT